MLFLTDSKHSDLGHFFEKNHYRKLLFGKTHSVIFLFFYNFIFFSCLPLFLAKSNPLRESGWASFKICIFFESNLLKILFKNFWTGGFWLPLPKRVLSELYLTATQKRGSGVIVDQSSTKCEKDYPKNFPSQTSKKIE